MRRIYVLLPGQSEASSVLNIYPYNSGHLMIIPYRETGSLEDLS